MLAPQSTTMTVADYCSSMDRNEIIVNSTYQRSDKVWPDSARSFLIESMLLGYPIPKIYLHSNTDLKSRKTIKEIIDGQQRSRAIHDFFHDRFSLAKTLETDELRNLSYSQLPEDWQTKFVSYAISIDLFVSASPDEVRQIFRRMNSYTVPLNPEELRHAEYQGAFKWFIYKKARKYEIFLSDIGVFSQKSFVRMQDLKLFTEICHAIENGITTTNKKSLNMIYKKYDHKFDKEEDFSHRIDFAFDHISSMVFIKGTDLVKPYMIYSLSIALINGFSPIPGFDKISLSLLDDKAEVERRLLELSDALNMDETDLVASPFRSFVLAASERTNVKDQRQTRVRTFQDALSGVSN